MIIKFLRILTFLSVITLLLSLSLEYLIITYLLIVWASVDIAIMLIKYFGFNEDKKQKHVKVRDKNE